MIPSAKEDQTMTPDDPRVIAAVEEYVRALEAGERPDREAFLARHADLQGVLATCLDGLQFMRAVRTQLDELAEGAAEEASVAPLGDFRIIREIGRGGMGIVYEAEQMSLGRRVALKVLPFAATLDHKQIQRFKNEAAAAGQLRHTSIVAVYFVGCERGVHFYAMEYIDGQNLGEMIADLRLQKAGLKEGNSEEVARSGISHLKSTVCNLKSSTLASAQGSAFFQEVARLGIQAAEALDHAHELGVIHRDVKPSNLLVDSLGRLFVTDFGLAQIRSDNKLTLTGDLVGTLRYMSPEQALAKRVIVDQRTDIYSLGATLYELLTGEPVFAGADRQELLRQIAFEEPKPPRRQNKSIPPELETIVLKALEKNPADRYATAHEVADDLRRFLEDKPIRAKRPALMQRAAKWSRRHRPLVWSAAIVALILTASLGWIVRDWQGRMAEAERRVAEALAVAEPKLREGNPHDTELISAVGQAEAQVSSGVVREHLRRRVEKLSADLKMLTRLEDIRLRPATHAKDTTWDWSRADDAYARAFHEYGIDLDVLSVQEAASRIHQRATAMHLAAALDDWARVNNKRVAAAEQPPRPVRWQHLIRVAQAADPDQTRWSLREAFVRGKQSLTDLNKLVDSVSVAKLAPSTLVLFGISLRNADAALVAEKVLRQGQHQYPNDFWINQQLGYILVAEVTPPKLQDAISFLRAALALRPNNVAVRLTLGYALSANKSSDEAMAYYKKL